ncbi:MAG: hypothetical protein JWM59_3629 [Verrucomicrobiales bacterium]|nr:hypothetical protein [Verrucomicrobiales bacterium]
MNVGYGERGRLLDSGQGFGLPPKWRSGIWFLPIDHLLISRHWRTLDRCVHTGDLGSDHQPLIEMLALSSNSHFPRSPRSNDRDRFRRPDTIIPIIGLTPEFV